MIRARTSLRDRGMQLLGMGRHLEDDGAMDSFDGPDGAAADVMSGSGGRSAAHKSTPDRVGEAEHEDGAARPGRNSEIDNLLSAEAETALGGNGSAAPTASEEDLAALPSTEWVLPSPESLLLGDTPSFLAGDHDGIALPMTPATEEPPLTQPAPGVPDTLPPQTSSPDPAPGPSRHTRPSDVPAANLDHLPVPGASETMVGSPRPPRSVPLTDEQRAEMLKRRDVQEKLAGLQRAIESEYQRVLHDDVTSNKDITDWCHNLLAEARVIVTYRDVGDLARAEWCVEQVRARLDRAERSAEQVRAPVLITLWGIAWFFLFVTMIFDPAWVVSWIGVDGLSDSFINPQVFLRALFFGGLGSVAAVFYHLFKYVRDRSFDGKYVLSYVGKPFMGMILGAMIYLTVFVAMRLLGLTPVGLAGSEAESLTNVLYMAVLYFVAMSVGFKENLAFGLLHRVIKRVMGDEDQKRPSEMAFGGE
jgi:hypothetical protein